MKEFRSQLSKMGKVIADSTHAATILRNVPESWRAISQTISMITRDPEIIEERLEAHEADLNALEVSNQAATAFVAQSKPNRPANHMSHHTQTQNHNPGRFELHARGNAPRTAQRPAFYQCNNCGRPGHSASRCYSPGGGLSGQTDTLENESRTVQLTCQYCSKPCRPLTPYPTAEPTAQRTCHDLFYLGDHSSEGKTPCPNPSPHMPSSIASPNGSTVG
jgi:hypothetical protein